MAAKPITLTPLYVPELALHPKDRRAGAQGVPDVSGQLTALGKDVPGHVRSGAELRGDTAKLLGKREGQFATSGDLAALQEEAAKRIKRARISAESLQKRVSSRLYPPEALARLQKHVEQINAKYLENVKVVPLEHLRPNSSAPVWFAKDIQDIALQRKGTGWKKLQARCRLSGRTQQFYCEGFGDANEFLVFNEGETWAFVMTDVDRAAGDYKMYTLPKEELYLSKFGSQGFRFTRNQSSSAGSHTMKRAVHHTTFFGNVSPIYAAGVISKRSGIFYYKMETGHYGQNQDLNQFKRLTSEFFAKEVGKGQARPGGYVFEER